MAYYDASGLDFLNPSSGSSSGGSPHGSSSGSSSPPSGGNGGGNGGGPAPSIDYGFDDSGGFIGEGWGGNPPPAPITVDTSGTGGGIIDVAAEQDAIDDALAISLANQNPPTDAGPYVPDWGENMVNVSHVGGGPNSPGSLLYGINLEDYGFDPKSEYLPQEFLQSLLQGTIVGEYENIITNDLISSGENWASGDAPDVIMVDPETGELVSVVGTWDMIENPEVYGEHPMFPGGLEDYYDMMDENWGLENWGEPGGYEDYWGDWGDYGGRRPSLAEYARQHWFSESLSDVEAKEARREAEGLGPATMSNMDRMFAKDFSAEIGPDPFFDPEFSYEMYEDYDPIFAGMDLFQRARG